MSEYTILVADDSLITRILLVKMIQTLAPKVQVMEAKDGEEALDLAQNHVFDAATLDFNMPGLNGLELAYALRAKYPQIGIGVVTASMEPEIQQQVADADLFFVSKPISDNTVRDFLHQTLPLALESA